MQQELYQDGKKESEGLLWGAQGVEGFRKFLIARFGTVACAWRTALDESNNGKISFGEFRQCSNELGYSGNLKKTWADMSADGFATLASLDPEAHQALTEFRDLCTDKYGSTIDAWNKAISPKGHPKVTEQDFCERCKAIGYTGNPKKLFRWMRTDMARKEINFHDLDPFAAGAICRGDPCSDSIGSLGGSRMLQSHTPKVALSPLAQKAASEGLSVSMSRSMQRNASGDLSLSRRGSQPDLPRSWSVPSSPINPTSPTRRKGAPLLESSVTSSLYDGSSMKDGHLGSTRTSEWIKGLSQAQIIERKAVKAEHMNATFGIKTPADFRHRLAVRFGSVLSAWQQFMDPHGKGKVSYNDMCDLTREIGYLGDVRVLWSALGAEEKGVLRLVDLDPEADAMLNEFNSVLEEKYGNMLQAWTQHFDAYKCGYIGKKAFEQKCAEHGLGANAATLFQLLQDKSELGDAKGRRLTLQEFCPQASKAFHRDDFSMLTEGKDKPLASPMNRSFEERQDGTFSNKWARKQSELSRDALKQSITMQMSMDHGCHDLGELHELLERRYGSVAAAWRQALDPLGQLQLSREELAKRVRAVGFGGDIRLLWKQLAKEESGFVTLHDFDPEAAELLWSFRSFLLEKYCNLVTAWRKGLDPNMAGRLDEGEFLRSCAYISFPGDAKKLFFILRAEPHKRYITIADVDPRAEEAYFRGDNKASTMGSRDASVVHSPKKWPGRAESPGSVSSPSSVTDKHTRITKWSEELGRRFRHTVVQSKKEELGRQMGITTLESFRKLLVSRYGSTVAAWRADVDPEGLNRLTFSMFCAAMQRIGGYTGNLKQLWDTLDPDCRGWFSFKELDEDSFNQIQAFRQALLGKYPSLSQVWHKGLAYDGVERVDQEVFLDRCGKMNLEGWGEKQLPKMLRLLLPGHLSGRRLVQIEDLKVLLFGVERTDRRAIWLGEAPATAQSQLQSPTSGHNNTMTSTMGAEEVAFGDRPNELPIHGPEALKKLLIAQFGSVYSGWFRHLDVTEAGRVPMVEFAKRVKAIGVTGSVTKLFREIDATNRGYITLQDLDTELAQMIEDFMRLARKKYGCLANSFKHMDVGHKGNLNIEDFVKGCSLIGFPGNAKKLFLAMQPEKGRTFLFLSDWGHQAVGEQREHWSMSPRKPLPKDDAPQADLRSGERFAVPKATTELRVEDSWSWTGDRQYLDATCFVYSAEFEQLDVVDNANRESLAGALLHSGDLMDEQAMNGRHLLRINLQKLPQEACFVYCSISAIGNKSLSDLGISDISLMMRDQEDKQLARFDVFAAQSSSEQTVLLGELRRRGPASSRWAFQAWGDLGQGTGHNLGAIEQMIFARRRAGNYEDDVQAAGSGTADVGIGRSGNDNKSGGMQDSGEMSFSSTASTAYPDGRPVSRGGLSMEDSRPTSRAERLGGMLPEEALLETELLPAASGAEAGGNAQDAPHDPDRPPQVSAASCISHAPVAASSSVAT